MTLQIGINRCSLCVGKHVDGWKKPYGILKLLKYSWGNKRYNAAAFYVHQAGEKAVKALLYSVNESPWGHSVRILSERFFEKLGTPP